MATILLGMGLNALAHAAGLSQAVREIGCDDLVQQAGSTSRVKAPSLPIIEPTLAKDGSLSGVPVGASVICERTSIVPAKSGRNVLKAGHPLDIIEVASGRGGVLEVSGG